MVSHTSPRRAQAALCKMFRAALWSRSSFKPQDRTMEHTLGQLQFDRQSLTALRTRLTRIVRWHLVEVFAVAFCHPVAPVKEHTPRRIRNGLGEVSVLNHVAWLEFLSNNGIKPSMVKKFVGSFRYKVKSLAGNNICLFCQCVFRLIPAFASVLLARQITMKFHKFAFGLSVKARVGYLLPIRSRQKIVCANIHTTSGFWNTFQRVRHFANDEAIPAACRLFQRDLFRISDERTVLADFHFTEFRHF